MTLLTTTLQSSCSNRLTKLQAPLTLSWLHVTWGPVTCQGVIWHALHAMCAQAAAAAAAAAAAPVEYCSAKPHQLRGDKVMHNLPAKTLTAIAFPECVCPLLAWRCFNSGRFAVAHSNMCTTNNDAPRNISADAYACQAWPERIGKSFHIWGMLTHLR